MTLDTGSVLVAVLAVGSATILFSWSFVLTRGSAAWNRYWALGNTCLFVGVALYLGQGTWDNLISIVLANALVVLGYLSIEAGLRKFAGLRIRFRTGAAVLAADVVFISFFTYAVPFFVARVIIQAVLSGALLVSTFLLLLNKIPDERRANRVLVFELQTVVFLLVIAQVGRIVLSVSESTSRLLLQSSSLVTLLVVSAVAIIAWTLGFSNLGLLRTQHLLQKSVAERDKMFALLAHDLRGPISGVTMLLEMVVRGEFPPDEEKVGIESASKASRNSYNLLEDLLEWALAQRGNISLAARHIDLKPFLESATAPLTLLASAKNIRLRVQADPDSKVWGDERTLTTVVRNLVSNALKFTPAGGAVSVDSWVESDKVKVRVSDSGPGLPPEFLGEWHKENLFRSSRGTDGERGSGLGLSLCREFVRANRGSISFASSKSGTQVLVELPGSPEGE